MRQRSHWTEIVVAENEGRALIRETMNIERTCLEPVDLL